MKILLTACLCALMLSASCRHGNKGKEIPPAGEKETISEDPLPSWSGELKEAIIDYVETVSDSASDSFIPPLDRIAVFDNDGTLMAEKPNIRDLFCVYMAKHIVSKKPALASIQPYKAILANDTSYFTRGGKGFDLTLYATHTGMREEEFDSLAHSFFARATYPHPNVPLKNVVYIPQLELLNYLRDNDFKTFICTGGVVDFIRGISAELYGIPAEQVIGTTFTYRFLDSNRSIMRLPPTVHTCNKEGKPACIQEHIGKRPVFTCGNEGGAGDIAMLKFSQGSGYRTFQMIVNHDDSAREFFYQEKDSLSLHEAFRNNWHVISMKNDWKTIFK